MMIRRTTLIALAALILLTGLASATRAQSGEQVRDEFHQTYPLAANGRVSLENINGSVVIKAWDRNEVRVDAVKTAYTRARLDEAKIAIESNPNSIRISTEYPSLNQTMTDDRRGRYNNPASVEYTLTLPRSARIDTVELINGSLDIEGITGDVNASSINGHVTARGLTGEAKLSTINGNLEATFTQLSEAKPVTLGSVNGNVTVTIPSDANALLKANTVHGGIKNDFGLPVQRGEYVGNDLMGQLGTGGVRIKLGNVNGSITIRKASDGRTPSRATNLLSNKRKNRDKDDDRDETGDNPAAQITRAAQREAARAQREAARAARDIARAVQETTNDQVRINSSLSQSEREAKSFTVNGVPRVQLETFDGTITVRGWDKPEVALTAVKRASDEKIMRGIRLVAEERGGEIFIKADFDKSFAARVNNTTNINATVNLELFVPRKTSLRVSTGDGRINVEGVTGEINLNTGDGPVEVRDSVGRLSVNTGDGRIRITGFEGEATARTGDGGIALDGRFTQLSVNTGDGSITLALPQDSDATIETNADSVINDGLTITEETDSSSRVRRWKIGRGGQLLKLNTGEGKIILRRSDAAR